MTTDEAEFDVVVVGQRRRRHDRRAHRRAARAAGGGAGEGRHFGGSTARSGGGIWAPGNEVLRRAGVADTAGAGPRLPGACRGGRVTAARQQALLAQGPAMVSFVRANAPLEFAWVPGYADYYPEAPGGVAQGAASSRCRSTRGCSGPELAHLNPPYLPAPEGVTITQADYRWLSLGPRHPRAMLTAAKIAARTARARLLGGAPSAWARPWPPGCGGPGGAAGAGLAGHAADRPGDHRRPRHRGPVTRDGQPAVIPASRGVVLAAGGFERNGRCGGATSARRSAPNGRPARPGTPATPSWPARRPGPRWT